jgi:hypothetical protein
MAAQVASSAELTVRTAEEIVRMLEGRQPPPSASPKLRGR